MGGQLPHQSGQPGVQIRRELELVLLGTHSEHRRQFRRRIVGKVDVTAETGTHAAVGVQKSPHLRGISGDDHDQPVAVVLHAFEQRRYGLGPVVGFSAAGQGIGLVDEQHPVKRRIDQLIGLDRGLSYVTADHAGTIGLDQMARLEYSQFPVDIAENPRHGGLAGSGIAGEHAVVRHLRDFEPLLAASLNDLGVIDQLVDLRLHLLQTDHPIQLRHRLLQGPAGTVGMRLPLSGGYLLRSLRRLVVCPGSVFSIRPRVRFFKPVPRLLRNIGRYQQASCDADDPERGPYEPLEAIETLDERGYRKQRNAQQRGERDDVDAATLRHDCRDYYGYEYEQSASDARILHFAVLLVSQRCLIQTIYHTSPLLQIATAASSERVSAGSGYGQCPYSRCLRIKGSSENPSPAEKKSHFIRY